jgi:hypothetical protein
VSYELVQRQSQHSNQEAKKKSNREQEKKEMVLANLLDKTVYRSGDWYILLLIMKYACKGRAKAEKQKEVGLFGKGTNPNVMTYFLRGTNARACE